MHTVVNHLPVRDDADWGGMAEKFTAFADMLKTSISGIRAAQLLRAGDTEAILVILFEDEATMKRVSSEVAAPWFAENFRPYLTGPPSRSVGEMIAGFA